MYWKNPENKICSKRNTNVKLQLPKYSHCNAEFNRNTNVIPITGLCNMITITTLGVPCPQKGIHGLKTAQARCSLQNCFVSCVVSILLCWAEPCIHSPRAGLAAQGETFIPPVDPLRSQPVIYNKSHPVVPFVLRQSHLLCNSCGQSPPVLLSELQRHITLGHLHRDFFHWRGLLVSHKAPNSCDGLYGVLSDLESTWLSYCSQVLVISGIKKQMQCLSFKSCILVGANKDWCILSCREKRKSLC